MRAPIRVIDVQPPVRRTTRKVQTHGFEYYAVGSRPAESLSLQSTAALASQTQNRLATGKRVNSALDNPGNFFTSSALNNRARDLNALLD